MTMTAKQVVAARRAGSHVDGPEVHPDCACAVCRAFFRWATKAEAEAYRQADAEKRHALRVRVDERSYAPAPAPAPEVSVPVLRGQRARHEQEESLF